MKKILALAAVAALAAGASAYAANPFSDVSTSDWAYQAVSDLSDQGVVEGYPDGTFKGQTNITRYEMAQIIARLMAKEDQYNAEQRATIDKLAGEYADELDSLGVRVSNLEKKVGNLSFAGDARMRFTRVDDNTDKYTGRIRVKVTGQVNDSTYVFGRLTTGNVNLKDNGDSTVKMDQLFVHHDFGDKVGVTIGRYGFTMGTQVGWLYDNQIDGAEAQFGLGDAATLKVGYGRFRDASDVVSHTEIVGGEETTVIDHEFSKAESFYAQAKVDLKAAKLGLDYYKVNDSYWGDEVFGVNLLIPAGDFRVFGDYYKNTGVENDPQIWAAGIGYGAMNLKKPGTWNLDVAYYDVEAGLYHEGMTGSQFNADAFYSNNGSFWLASTDVALAKNTYLHGEYAFGSDLDDNSDGDLDDSWTLSLNYKF